MKQNSKKLYFIIFTVVTALIMGELFLSNRLTVEGRKIETIQEEVASLEEENSLVKNQIASLGGLNRLTQAAKEKGFIKAEAVLNLTRKATVAVRPQ